ncbi:Scramblase-domain-containing protein [Pilobolus umbonatus]|nr:Scramblase-domain-containing protein [Pilobolus umbonatus]
MFRTLDRLLTRSTRYALTRNKILLNTYSSLRTRRVTGPRSRVMSHVEHQSLRNTKPISRETLVYEKPGAAETSLVEVPIDLEHNIVKPETAGGALLTQPAMIIGRQIEMLNVFLGYEQANRYKIMDAQGNNLGFIAEEEGLGKSIGRQFLGTHRKMQATVLNPEGEVLFKIIRPYSLINSKIMIYTEEDELIGEVHQRWNLVRRKYDLFVGSKQFAAIDTPILGWDFNLQDENGGVLGNVSRNFVGFAREIFTDTGEYALRMDAVEGNARGMTLDERAVTLACAISIDFDYFSRHTGRGGLMDFMFFPAFGGGPRHEENPQPTNETSPIPPPTDTVPPPPSSTTNEYGDEWLSDDQAGVSSPSDTGFIDSLKDFFDE